MKNHNELDHMRHMTPLPAKLVFDTATDQSLKAGLRRREASSRHLLYEIHDLCLDLRLEQPPRSSKATVVGQLADRRDPLKPLAGFAVILKSGDKILAQTISNRRGEFHVEYEAEDDTRICLPISHEELIEVAANPQPEG